MKDQLFYNRKGIQVSNSHMSLMGQSYPLGIIDYVSVRAQEPDRKWPIICIVLGFVSCIGFPVTILGVLWLLSQKTTYWLVVNTSAGVLEPFSSQNQSEVQELQMAIAAARSRMEVIGPSAVQSNVMSTGSSADLRSLLLQAAAKRGGQLSVAQAVMDTGLGFEQVEQELQAMLKKGYIDIGNAVDSGVVVYIFPGL